MLWYILFRDILFGMKQRYDAVGVVGDWCRDCGRVRKFDVLKYYRVHQFLGIPLGSWQYVSTSCACWSCGARFYCQTKEFDDFLTEEEAKQLPAREVVRLTNGRRMKALRAGDNGTATVCCPHCDTEFRPALSRGDLVCPSCDCVL